MTAYTTLNKIRSFEPCKGGWAKLLYSLEKTEDDDEPLALTTVLENNGVSDAVWCLRALDNDWHKNIVLFAADCAEHVLPFFEKKYPDDKRPQEAIEAARSFDPVRAKAAFWPADAAWAAAEPAEPAAAKAAEAAKSAAWAAVNPAWAAWVAEAADEALNAVWVAVETYKAAETAVAAEKEYQTQLFIKYFGERAKP